MTGGLGQRAQGLQRLGAQEVALLGGGFGHLAVLVGGLGDQGAQGFAAGGGGLSDVLGRGSGLGQDFRQLGLLALHLGGEVFLFGAQRHSHGDERRALFGEAFLDRADLVADACAGGLQASGLTRQVFTGDSRRIGGVAGGGGEISGARCQRGFGLADLGFGQVRGFGHHACLTADGILHLGYLGAQRVGHMAQFGAFSADGAGEFRHGAGGRGGGFHQLRGLRGQNFAQRPQLVAGLGRGVDGGVDLTADHLHRRTRAGGRQGGGSQHVLGGGPGVTYLGAELQALVQHACGGPQNADGPNGPGGQQGERERREGQRLNALGVAREESQRDRGPKHRDDGGDRIGHLRCLHLGRRRQKLCPQAGLCAVRQLLARFPALAQVEREGVTVWRRRRDLGHGRWARRRDIQVRVRLCIDQLGADSLGGRGLRSGPNGRFPAVPT